MHILRELVRHGELLGRFVHLVVAQGDELADLAVHGAHVAHGLDHVASARLALRTDHRRALLDAAQCFAEVLRAADKRHIELGFVDVIDVIGRGEHFGLVDVIDLDRLQDARFGDVADAHLRHDRDGNGLLDAADHGGVAHAAHAAGRADVCGDTLERHDGASARVFRDARLLGRGDVHDDTALEHLGEVLVEFVACSLHELFSLVPSVRLCGLACRAWCVALFREIPQWCCTPCFMF